MARETMIGRQNLPIPDAHQPYPGLVTYDAKDPATNFAPTQELRPPAGAPNGAPTPSLAYLPSD